MTNSELQSLTISDFIKCNLENDKELLDIIELASSLTGIPIAAITLLDEYNLYVKEGKGFPITTFPRELSFCTHTLEFGQLMIINNTLQDKRFANNPYVTDKAKIRFYAGAPLISTDGQKFGVLCVIDKKENSLDSKSQLILNVS